MNSTLSDILEWSESRPRWQRDALRRIVVGGPLTASDISELANICKADHGLVDPVNAEPLTTSHVATSAEKATDPAVLVALTHHSGVNALAPEQTVSFGPALTIVYGDNGSGKSGYSRILKRACRSRFVENILGNVLSGTQPLSPTATITVKGDPKDIPISWSDASVPSPALATVSVFDAHCVPVYLKDRTDVAFRPFGLDVFDSLASACSSVRALLEGQRNMLLTTPFVMPPTIPAGTKAHTFVAGLTALTKDTDLVALATLSQDEQKRLKELAIAENDAKAADPTQLIKDLTQKASRIETLSAHVTKIVSAIGVEKLTELATANTSVVMASKAAEVLRESMLKAEVIPQTGSPSWRTLWDSAETFAMISASTFPPVVGQPCPFCQQEVGEDAASRVQHFAEFVASSAQAGLRATKDSFETALSAVVSVTPEQAALTPTIAEVTADNELLGSRVGQYLAAATATITAVLKWSVAKTSFPSSPVDESLVADLNAVASSTRQRVKQLRQLATAPKAADAETLRDLLAREALALHLDVVRAEIRRKAKINAFGQALEDTTTNLITAKSTDLTTALVTDKLTGQFKDELKRLKFTHLLVEIREAGGSKGVLFHKLAFSNAPNVAVASVISEGEGRALSLAAFLTELSTAPAGSGIIFDDPVSSLDHIWRERIAERLVDEAKVRQVIVFTHDLVFLRSLITLAEKQSVAYQHQYLRREGLAGVTSSDLPWVAMKIKERLGILRKRLQDARATFNAKGPDAFESEARDIFGMLREAWERGIIEVLLSDTVDRYRQDIATKKVRHLHDITEDDCKNVESGMAEASRWMRGHDEPPAEGTPFPTPDELAKCIDQLDEWAKRINKRRN